MQGVVGTEHSLKTAVVSLFVEGVLEIEENEKGMAVFVCAWWGGGPPKKRVVHGSPLHILKLQIQVHGLYMCFLPPPILNSS